VRSFEKKRMTLGRPEQQFCSFLRPIVIGVCRNEARQFG